MSKAVQDTIQALFASQGKTQPVDFEWRLACRHGRPFMLLPVDPKVARTGLNLYLAQRWQAKIWRRSLPWMFRTPLAGFFEPIRFQADASAEIIQFMARQVDIAAECVFPAAIKISEIGSSSRLVLLLCDESGRPACVIKAGLNPNGRMATDKEADFLAQLPAGKLGGVRLTGRISTPTLSAFSMDYFPGASPHDDAGLEHLFHDWLNPDEVILLESLPVWHGLSAAVGASHLKAWRQINLALAGKTIHTTLYHGDFTPWNVRVVSSRNLQAFDWERGDRHGIPGWDWFHFTVQTAILARRHSVERAAAEVEELIHSMRFKKYAAAAGIAGIVEPLLLAYLLNHVWVTKPSEGCRKTAALFDLLAAHWLKKPPIPAVAALPAPVEPCPAVSWVAAGRQLAFAARQWRDLFWEPSLNFRLQASWRKEFQAHWFILLITIFLLAVIATAQFYTTLHLTFLPFYVFTCALLAWKAGRRLGALLAAVAAVVAPLVVAARDVDFRVPEVVLWNATMRFIILQMCVLFVDRIHKQRQIVHHRPAGDSQPVKLSENWAVVLASATFLAIIGVLDYITNPHLIFLPLYLFPCMMLKLVSNLRWGITAALIATAIATWVECLTNQINYHLTEIFAWNFSMRLSVCLLVLFLLHRIRKENILFRNRKLNLN
ncbi:MAG: hypothetical protein WDM80_01485 [Limisphaerales bacterium]